MEVQFELSTTRVIIKSFHPYIQHRGMPLVDQNYLALVYHKAGCVRPHSEGLVVKNLLPCIRGQRDHPGIGFSLSVGHFLALLC
jgi:hypothetical protein